LYVVQS